MTLVALAKADRRQHIGAAMAAGGSVVAGTGLAAGGLPGAKEPNALEIWNIRGRSKGALKVSSDPREAQSRFHPRNAPHNARKVAFQPRAGILGFRADTHNAFIGEHQHKTHGDAYVRGMRSGKLDAEAKIVRGMRVARRASYPVTLAGAGLAAAGVRQMRKKPAVVKRDNRREQASAAAVGGGVALAGVGHGGAAALSHFSRSYAGSAQRHVLDAERLAPHFGGVKTIPAKIGEFGETRRRAKVTMYPARSDKELAAEGAQHRIQGGDSARAEVGRHRGIAAQERHFSEVFNRTAKGVRRVRNPGLAIAGAGATGVWASHDSRRKSGTSRFAKNLMDQEQSISQRRAFGVGLGSVAAGAGISALPSTSRFLRMRAEQGPRAGHYAIAEARRAKAVDTMSLAARQAAGIGLGAGPLRRIPTRLRPAAAIVGGAALIHHSLPLTRTTTRPVTLRYPNQTGA